MAKKERDLSHALRAMVLILGPERPFYVMAIVYGVGVSLLTLAAPISVQMLINTVANTSRLTPLLTLSVTLFTLLLVSGLLTALRQHLMEIFGRRFYARMTAEIAVRAIFAKNPFFQDDERSDLFNRYFDITIVQKAVPQLLVGGFTILLQAVTGFILVSFYHPFFLAFNLILIGCGALVWQVWGPTAMASGIELSHAKFNTGRWLQSLGASNGFYKSEGLITAALDQSDLETRAYIKASERHFRNTFAQSLSLLLLYAAATAALLALGGWLVIQNQLTLGQLVAAELVLTAIFLGMAQFATYLDTFYEMFAAVDKLSYFLEVPQEEPDTVSAVPASGDIAFLGAQTNLPGRTIRFDLNLPSGVKAAAAASDPDVARVFTRLLKRISSPDSGLVTIGGIDIEELSGPWLRREVVVLQRPQIVECRLRDFLNLTAPDAAPETLLEALRLTGLEDTLRRLPEGLDTQLHATGAPLSIVEVMLLRLAAALLDRPHALVLGEIFDVVPEARMRAILQAIPPETTVLYFTDRGGDLGFTQYLWLGPDAQGVYTSRDEFDGRRRLAAPPAPALLTRATP